MYIERMAPASGRWIQYRGQTNQETGLYKLLISINMDKE